MSSRAGSSGSVGSNAVVFLLGLSSSSFAAIAYGLNIWMDQNKEHQNVLHALLASQVPSVLFALPVAAFGGVLLLNALNVPHSKTVSRFKSNFVLLYINVLALATDILIYLGETPVFLGGSRRITLPLRYIQWAHTTPTMVFMMSLMSDLSYESVIIAMANCFSMMVTGLASSLSTSMESRTIFGIISFANFFVVMFFLSRMVLSAMKETSDRHSKSALKVMLGLMITLWTSYPIVWLLSELDLISPALEHISIGVCDYLAKAVFTSQIWQSNIQSVEEHRQQALAIWEHSNRALVIEKLNGLVKAKEQMLHVISHELRTPLLGIQGLASMLLKETKKSTSSSHLKHLSMIRSTAACTINIVNATVDTNASLDGDPAATGQGSTDLSKVSLHTLRLQRLVDEVVTMVQPLVHDGVMLLNELPPDMPLVLGDKTKLSQVLFNLIGNAARFTLNGQIKILAIPRDLAVDIIVSDTGSGVPMTELESMFKPYQQGGSAASSNRNGYAPGGYTGLGLGLHLVKLSLQSMGSSVTVQSEVGRGTVFTFQLKFSEACNEEDMTSESASHSGLTDNDSSPLPQLGAPSTTVDPAAAEAPAFRAPHRFSNATLLVLSVDDDMVNQVVAERVLKNEKWQVVKAFDGLQAIEYIENSARTLPDVILLDIMMPNMNGYEVCAKVREKYPSPLLPIIMLSAKGREEDIVEALRCGADDYLVKPFKRAELVERIRSHIRARESSKGLEAMARLAVTPVLCNGGSASSKETNTSMSHTAIQSNTSFCRGDEEGEFQMLSRVRSNGGIRDSASPSNRVAETDITCGAIAEQRSAVITAAACCAQLEGRIMDLQQRCAQTELMHLAAIAERDAQAQLVHELREMLAAERRRVDDVFLRSSSRPNLAALDLEP